MKNTKPKKTGVSCSGSRRNPAYPQPHFAAKKIHPNAFYYKRKEHRTEQFIKLSVPAVGISSASGIKIRTENITIEPGTDIRENQLKLVIRSVPKVQFSLHPQK